ncbi:MAG: HAD family hydrolase [Patescibacteria group bacterium]
MKKLFIWDFHGTLEKGNENAVREYINMALAGQDYERRITDSECKLLYGKKIWEFFQYLLPEASLERCKELMGEFLKAEQEHIDILLHHIKPNDGALEILEAIHTSPHEQILISNTEIPMLMPFINSIGADRYFPEGYRFATHSHSGSQTTKHHRLQAFIEGKQFDHFVAIGDSPSDLDYVRAYASTTYLYSHPGWDFRDYSATYRIRDLREVLKEL